MARLLPKRRTSRRLLAAGLSLLFTIFACEVALRGYLWIRGWTANCYATELDIFVPHPTAGYQVRHNFRLRSGTFHVTTNSRGMRGPEVEQTATPGVTRLVIMGESSAFGYLVSDGQEAARLLESRLRSAGRDVQVVNAASPGYNLYQGLIRYREDIAPFEPDVVLLYLGWNDLAYAVADNPAAPHFQKRLVHPWWRRALGKSATYGFVFHRLLGKPAAMMQADFGGTEVTAQGQRQFLLNLRSLIDAIEADGAQVVLGIQATAAHPEVSPAMRLALAATPEDQQSAIRLGQWLHDTEKELAIREGLPSIDAYGRVPPTEQMFGDYVHLTAEGEKRLAEIWEEGLLPMPSLR